MHRTPIEQLKIRRRRRLLRGTRVWREYLFFLAALKQFRVRFLLILGILLGGAFAFRGLEPERGHSVSRSLFYSWSLLFGQAPEALPASRVLQSLFFIYPLLGQVVLIEGVLAFALLLRDRRLNERSWCIMMANAFSDHIVLVGLGRLGIRTFRLLRRLGEDVVVIERDADNQFLDEVRRDGSPLLVGDARRDTLLEEANVARARSIILATNDDLANLEAALDARRLVPGIRVVLRLFDQTMADKIRDGFNIRIAMSQSALSAPAFVTAAIEPSIVNSFVVNDDLLVMLRWPVRPDGPMAGKTVGELTGEMGIGFVEYATPARERRLFPPPQTRLEAGGEVLVQGRYDQMLDLRERVDDVHAHL